MALVMIMGSFSFAATGYGDAYKKAMQGDKLSSDLILMDKNSNEPVRVIIELYGTPIIERATAQGLHVEDMSKSTVASLTNTLEKEQKNVMATLEKTDAKIEFHEQFTAVFNGVSATVSANQIKKISQLEQVKKVYIANAYERPVPQMVQSHKLTQSKYVNEQLGYKGEGLVVAIIDTGIDPSHKDFTIDPDAQPLAQLQPGLVSDLILNNSLKGQYHTLKVPYGYNYMDQNQVILDLGPDASMHGMHVAGTVAANGELQGVAPNAQVLAMKVFGNDPDYPSTYGDVLIAAIDDAIMLGADVMNMSLGSTASFVDREDPEQHAITRAVENGILMSISAGNSAFFGNAYDLPYATNPDIGVVGSPGLVSESLQVASVDNILPLFTHQISVDGLTSDLFGYGKDDWQDGSYELVAIGGTKLGVEDSDYEGIDVTGKVVLVSRGGYSFYAKTQAAAAHGAAAIIVYNNDPSRSIYFDQGGWDIPFLLTNVDGQALEALIAATPEGVLDINVATTLTRDDPNSGSISSFSSWGTTPDLSFKPDIAAPGGNIYSTLNNNQYGFMSGTSMAAPHAAGGAALVLQRLNNTTDFANFYHTQEEKVKLAKAIMMNTARPVADTEYWFGPSEDGVVDLTTLTSPRSQGAGSMDLRSAILTDVVVLVKDTLDASFNAGEVTDGFEFTLTAYNQGTTDAEFGINTFLQTNMEDDGYNMLDPMLLWGAEVSVTVNGLPVEYINVPAGGALDIRVAVDLDGAYLADTDKLFFDAFPNGNFVEGFVFLYTREDSVFGSVPQKRAEYEAALTAVLENEALIEATEAVVATDLEALEAAQLVTEAAQVAYDEAVLLYADIMAQFATFLTLEADMQALQAAYDALVAAHGTYASQDEKLLALKDLAAKEVVYLEEQLKLATLNSELGAIKKMIKNLNKDIDALKAANAALQAEKDSLDPVDDALRIAEINVEMAANSAAIQTKEIDLATQELAKAAKEAEIDVQKPIRNTARTARNAAKNAAQNLGIVFTTPFTLLEVQEMINALQPIVDDLKLAFDALGVATIAFEAEQANFTETQIADMRTAVSALEALLLALETAMAEEALLQETYDANLLILTTAQGQVEALETALDEATTAYLTAEKTYRRALPLSVPFISFLGEWDEAPAFDGKRTSDDTFYGMTDLVYNHTDEDAGYWMGQVPAFSPNGDGVQDSIASVISFLRNMKNVSFNIENEAGDTIKVLGISLEERKDYYDGRPGGYYSYFPQMKWNGKVNLKTAPDGMYTYVVKGQIATGAEHEIRFPVMLDVTAPEFTGFTANGTQVTFNFEDALSGVKEVLLFKVSEDGLDVEVIGRNAQGTFDLSQFASDDIILPGAIDFAGNIVIADEGTTIGETDIPLVHLTTPASHEFQHNATVTFEGTIEDASPVTFYIDGQMAGHTDGAIAPVPFSADITFDTDGKKIVPVKAVDAFGNTYEFSRIFFLDTHAPDLTVLARVGEDAVTFTDGVAVLPTGTQELALNINAGDNFPMLELKFNESTIYKSEKDWYSYQANIAPVTTEQMGYLPLEEGANLILVEALDVDGLRTAFAATVYVGQPEGPAINLVDPTTGELISENITVNFMGPDSQLPEGNNNGTNTVPNPIPVGGGTANNPPAGNGGQVANNPPANNGGQAANNPPAGNSESEVTLNDPVTPLGAMTFTKAYINGYANGMFKASATVTRAEFAKMMATVLGLQSDLKADVTDADGQWFTPYVNAVVEAGLMKPYADKSFKPNQAITRAEIVEAMANFWTINKVEIEVVATPFTDIAMHASQEAIAKAFSKGIINGYTDNTFRADNTATRAEAVKMINTLIGRKSVKPATATFADVPTTHWAFEFVEAASSATVVEAASK